MLHHIEPYQYRCEFLPKNPVYNRDYILVFDDERILLKQTVTGISIPQICDMADNVPQEQLRYLFSISEASFYLYDEQVAETDNLRYQPVRNLREFEPQWLAFAGITAHHLYHWYRHNRYCGACGGQFSHHETERALVCAKCGYIKYPEIAIAVIVGVTRGDELLLAKYSGRPYNHFALIAGFTEIGESLADTVRREVFEEVGLRVKNIKYYGSQPWGFSRSLLAGFFAELDGPPDITLDHIELAEAAWVKRADIPVHQPVISLTATMMDAFKRQSLR